MNFKRILAVACLAAGAVAPVLAQENTPGLDYKRFPHMFVGIQGGGQTTFSHYDNSKLITPTASVYFGNWFTPVVGARLHVNGLWNKGGLHYNGTATEYDYKYATTNLDLMLNLCTMFSKKDYFPLNVYLIGGYGLNVGWDNDDAYAMKDAMPLAWDGKRMSHNGRIGAMLDWNLAKHWSLNLEVAANSLSDRYNSKINTRDDWQVTAQIGIAYKFGFKKNKLRSDVTDYVDNSDLTVGTDASATSVVVRDTVWYDDISYTEEERARNIEQRIFYNIRESNVEANEDAKIKEIKQFVSSVKNPSITITSYADAGTGNPQINMGYSKQRAEKTKKALVDAGIDASIIKIVEWKGDTVQPYPNDNDKNRVSIITVSGTSVEKKQVVTQKFRITER